MLVTLTGQNHFALQAALRQRVDAFVAEYTDMGLELIDGEESSVERIRESLESVPFLVAKKLVVLRSPGQNKQFMERAQEVLATAGETTDVLIVEPRMDKRTAYYKYLQKHTQMTSYDELDENGLSRWLTERAKEQGGSISMGDARYLVTRLGANQQLLAQEIDKLVIYDAKVSKKTIDLLVDPTPQSTIFELLDAAFNTQLGRAMSLYKEQRSARVEPQQIMAMIAWQLHVLAVVKAAGGRDPADVARAAKLNPFVVRKSAGIAGKLGADRLRTLIHQATMLDANLKSSALNADDAVQQYIIELSKQE